MVIITSKSDIELIKQKINCLINSLAESLKAVRRTTFERDRKISEIKKEAALKVKKIMELK